MIILSIDPGSSCGWAVGDRVQIFASGVWQLAPGRGESPGMRYIRLRNYLNQIREAYPGLKLVVGEMAHQRGGAATEYAIGVTTHLQSWCTEKHIEYATAHSATVKRWATGKGNAKKPDMVAAGRARFKTTSLDDNEIDALWILDWARATYDAA